MRSRVPSESLVDPCRKAISTLQAGGCRSRWQGRNRAAGTPALRPMASPSPAGSARRAGYASLLVLALGQEPRRAKATEGSSFTSEGPAQLSTMTSRCSGRAEDSLHLQRLAAWCRICRRPSSRLAATSGPAPARRRRRRAARCRCTSGVPRSWTARTVRPRSDRSDGGSGRGPTGWPAAWSCWPRTHCEDHCGSAKATRRGPPPTVSAMYCRPSSR